MEFNKRQFLKASGAALAALPLGNTALAAISASNTDPTSELKSLIDNVIPISVA